MDKYIFLDFDGVITTQKSGYKLDREKLDLLKEIIDATGAKLVISSSWRVPGNVDATKTELSKESFFNPFPFPFVDLIVGSTISGPARVVSREDEKPLDICRGLEIDHWLRTHTNYYSDSYRYVILDDDSDMLLNQKDNFVKTDTYRGLNRRNVEKAIRILNR